MTSAKITPMIQQYLAAKEKYEDALLFFRMGDFYEMFFEDAETASRVLEITLTSRNKKDKKPIPMCGVPVKAVRSYLSRLIEKGYKVAICDQLEDPSQAKGLVKRDVVRVVTPGMLVENELLDEKTNNYLLAVGCDDRTFGLASLDISTGTFRVAESRDVRSVIDEALRVSPNEVLVPESFEQNPQGAAIVRALSEKLITHVKAEVFGRAAAYERLTEQFDTLTLEGFGCEQLTAGIRAAGAVLYYVGETQKQKLAHIARIEPYAFDQYLMVDDTSCRNLELLANIRSGTRRGTLIGVIDRTQTAMGARLLKRWLRYPLVEPPRIERRLDAVQEAVNCPSVRNEAREHLSSVYDLERLTGKINMGQANARELVALKVSLRQLPLIVECLEPLTADLFRLDLDLDGLRELSDLIDRSIREDAPPTLNEGGIIKKGYHSELDELIQISREGKGYLVKLENQERESTGINTLKVRYNKVFGYYIEVSKAQSRLVPDRYIRRQTLVNAERYITEELKSFESKVLNAEDRRAALEYTLFNEVKAAVVANNSAIRRAAEFAARVDCLLGLAEIAVTNHYNRPELSDDGELLIDAGRHPVVEKMISGERFVPNTIRMDDQTEQLLIITGPNMAGKSTILRQVALVVILSQMGSFVPAERARIPVIDRIFTRVGALDNLSQGQSTFMVEMEETANILNNATPRSLIILDEIGRGTSTFDGLSIAWAVAEYLHDYQGRGVKTLFATHYHELTELALTKDRVGNYNVAVREWNDEIIFLRKLVAGGTNRSYGIQVARLAGIPKDVIRRARKILSNIENEAHTINGSPVLAAGDEPPDRQRQVQLNLFGKKEHALMTKLNQLDIARMTPLDALNALHELQEALKK